MNAAKPNNYGITHTGYATDMSPDGDLRTQLKKAGKDWQETALNMGTLFAESARIITYESKDTGVPVSVLIIPLVGADSWCEEYYTMVGTSHEDAIARDWVAIIRKVRDLAMPESLKRKAYSVSYTTEDANGNAQPHDAHTKYFYTRDEAVREARILTDDAEDDDGVFVSAWFTQGDNQIRCRIVATITEMLYEDVPDA